MNGSPAPQRDQALIVNAPQRGREVLEDPTMAGEVFLGDWSPYRGRATTTMDFDPDRIAVVIGCFQGTTLAAIEPTPDENGKTWEWKQSPDYPGRRIRFHGVPSKRFAAHVGADAPATWRQGEMWPVKTVSLDELAEGDTPIADTATGRRAVLGDAVVAIDADGNISVTVPAGRTVTVSTKA